MLDDVFRGMGVEVLFKHSDDFLKIKETLTRIGVASRRDNILYQSCHILHKRGRYAIVHFKEMFELDGRSSNISDEDIGRRNRIALLLEEWGLLTVVKPEAIQDNVVPLVKLKVLPFTEKASWQLVAKYNVGKKTK